MTDQADQKKEPALGPKKKVSFNLELDPDIILALEKLKAEYGVQTRSKVIELLLESLILKKNTNSNEQFQSDK